MFGNFAKMTVSFENFGAGSLPICEETAVEHGTRERWHADCMDCGVPTFECMGFVLARDFNTFNEAKEGGIEPGSIWARCAQCVEKTTLQTERMS